MQNLGVTMSYTVVLDLVKRLGENHDSKVLEWCKKLTVAKLYNVSYFPLVIFYDTRNNFIRPQQPQQTHHIYMQIDAISTHDVSLDSSTYSSPRAPDFETDISVDDEGHAPDEDSISSVHSDESTSAPLSPPGMIICVRSVQRNMYHCILNFRKFH